MKNAKYFILHCGRHEYSVECAVCGAKKTLNDEHMRLEIVKVVSPSCDECSPDYEGGRLYEYYTADGSRLMNHGIKHPDGSWSKTFFKNHENALPLYVRRNAVNLKEGD